MFNNLISSQNMQNLEALNLKNDTVNAKNAEILYVVMCIFNEVASNQP